jgi:hypothetical protein
MPIRHNRFQMVGHFATVERAAAADLVYLDRVASLLWDLAAHARHTRMCGPALGRK